MRITKPGDLDRIAPWWTKGTWVCQWCNAEFVLDQTDAEWVSETDDQRDGASATTRCPFCFHQTYAYQRGGHRSNGWLPDQ